jgi:colanic acid biosynthesis glycosyl transferase WcaI
MKVLILTQHFPPETVGTGRRALDLAESLAGRGHQVTVITGVPNHPSSLGRSYCHHAPREERTAEGYHVLRVPVFRSADARPLNRLMTYGTFMLTAAWRGLRQPRPEVIIAVSPLPTGLAALPARLWHRTKLVYDLQDIWPESALVVGVMEQGLALRMLKRIERLFYGSCAAVVGLSEGFKRYLVALGLPPGRVAVIHNGVDWEMFAGAQPNDQLRHSPPFAGRFVVGYIGNIGLAQRLETVLEAAQLLRAEPIAFLLMGEGVEKRRLLALARDRGLENVRFLAGVPRLEVPAVLAACDALLVILRRDPLFEITIPSKLYEYMAAGKPVLCSVGGEVAALVAESKCGLPVPPSDGQALAESIRKLVRDPERCRTFGEAGAAWVRAHFSRASVMDTYAKLLEDLTKGTSSVDEEIASPGLERMASKGP